MKVLFVDHQFHKKTGSSNFFLSLLESSFAKVDVEHVDVENQQPIRALSGPRTHDLVVLWQVDFLAASFVAAGYATVVVPMYDGSAILPYEHWVAMNGASIVCFSRTVYERVLASGCRAHLIKYFLEPCREVELPRFTQLKGVLWLRRPQDGISPRHIEAMMGSQLSSLHIHNAPDDGRPRVLSNEELRAQAFPTTESRWTGNSGAYLKAVGKSNVFFAPRLAEGIGLTMLEAFARGLLVVAHDEPVHNEYIANWLNGILVNFLSPSAFTLDVKLARDIAYSGWRGCVDGHQEWLDSRSDLMTFMRETPHRDGPAGGVDQDFVMAFWDAYLLGPVSYRQFLSNQLIGTPEDPSAPASKASNSVKVSLKEAFLVPPLVDRDGLYFGTSPNSVGKSFGLRRIDAFSATLISLAAGFSVRLVNTRLMDSRESLVISYRVEAPLSEAWKLAIHVNCKLQRQVLVPDALGTFELEIPIPEGSEHELHIMLSFLPSVGDVDTSTPPAISLFSVRYAAARSRDFPELRDTE